MLSSRTDVDRWSKLGHCRSNRAGRGNGMVVGRMVKVQNTTIITGESSTFISRNTSRAGPPGFRLGVRGRPLEQGDAQEEKDRPVMADVGRAKSRVV